MAMAMKVSSSVHPTALTTWTSRRKNQTVDQWNFSLVTRPWMSMAPRTVTIAALIQVPGRGTGLGLLRTTFSSSEAGEAVTAHSFTAGLSSAVVRAASFTPQFSRIFCQMP